MFKCQVCNNTSLSIDKSIMRNCCYDDNNLIECGEYIITIQKFIIKYLINK